jgi:hypothetical protein
MILRHMSSLENISIIVKEEIIICHLVEIVLEIHVSSVAHACVGYRRNMDFQYNLLNPIDQFGSGRSPNIEW